MVRKEPFKRISVADRIYEALDARRREETKDEFRPLPMNAYAEKILWDYAQGKLIRAGSSQVRGEVLSQVVGISGELVESPHEPGESSHTTFPEKTNANKKPRRQAGK